MAEYKLKDISSLSSLGPLDKVEVEVEGIEEGKVLLVKLDDKVHALSPKCTHYGAPLKNGVVTSDGRITCPWHGGMFINNFFSQYADVQGPRKGIPYQQPWKPDFEVSQTMKLTLIACFSVSTGDVEDAPAPNALTKYEVFERDGAVYVNAKEEDIKFGQRNPVVKCSVSKQDEKVVVVGG